MKVEKQYSFGFKLLKALGFNYSESAYGNVTLFGIIKRFFRNIYAAFLLKHFMNSALLEPISPRKLRPFILRKVGCKVGKGVFIGANVIVDSGHADYIELEDNVHIAGQCTLLCHQRDLSNYFIGDDYSKLGYIKKKVHLKKGCLIGMNTLILPGVTVGEGAIVGAGSLVSKDIPAWTIATGRPARVVKNIPERKSEYKHL